jgi:uncharacterized linocin/CFP29 family protein
MDLLKRELAPILPEAWKLIDAEATRVLRLNLAGRKFAAFKSRTNLRTELHDTPEWNNIPAEELIPLGPDIPDATARR